jgi:predicted nucleic acid-binding protein
MPMIYVDPSVLVGSLIQDANTERGMKLLGSAKRPFVLTELVNLEILNALEFAEFRQPAQSVTVVRARTRFKDSWRRRWGCGSILEQTGSFSSLIL